MSMLQFWNHEFDCTSGVLVSTWRTCVASAKPFQLPTAPGSLSHDTSANVKVILVDLHTTCSIWSLIVDATAPHQLGNSINCISAAQVVIATNQCPSQHLDGSSDGDLTFTRGPSQPPLACSPRPSVVTPTGGSNFESFFNPSSNVGLNGARCPRHPNCHINRIKSARDVCAHVRACSRVCAMCA